MFVCLIVSFAYTRLFFFPVSIVLPTLQGPCLCVPPGTTPDLSPCSSISGGLQLMVAGLLNQNPHVSWPAFLLPLFLCVLQVLHVLWFGMLLRTAFRIVFGSGVREAESAYEGRPDDAAAAPKKMD